MKVRAFPRSQVAQAVSLVLGSSILVPLSVNGQELEEVIVTGIRQSLETSMDLKRDSQGIVDGIVAEDIGKFPDTNLAEALQRIPGVSIDRINGEGQRVTVRGVGPDFNLVLLNGRQMPGARIEETIASNSRSFDFANLAAESISAVEVFKTSRASTPTGGIGATINILTTRPLDDPGLHSSIGVKAMYDTSLDNTPDHLQGDTVTPEISGIYSNTFADDRFGIAISGSYQKRDFGYNQASVGNGWRRFEVGTNDWGTIPNEGQPGYERITNPPQPGDVYSVPQNLGYAFYGVERERINGQLALQMAVTDNLVATLDYTYSQNKINYARNELSVWFNFGPSSSTWTDGPVAGPLLYTEIIPGGSDLSMGGAKYGTKNENNSVGFNLAWNENERFGLALDFHSSEAEAGPNSPYGSNSVLGAAGFFRADTTGDFSGDLPIISLGDLYRAQTVEGVTTYIPVAGIDPSLMLVTGSSFRNSYMKSEIEQGQLSGHFDFNDSSRLDFGVAATEVKNRSAFAAMDRGSWGGTGTPDDYPDELWHPDTVRHYFSSISGNGNPALFDHFFSWDFEDMRNAAVAVVGDPNQFLAPTVYTTDRRVKEESQSAYVQWSTSWDWNRPMNLALGVRYENTDVTSSALVPIATAIEWGSNNEYTVIKGDPDFTTLEGSYDYFLPSIDWSMNVTDELIVRASYGETIGRPQWDQIQGGQTLENLARVDAGTGAQGNPGLKPLLSKNIDLSVEWYHSEGSYVALAYFHKDVDNYIGTGTIVEQPFELHTPANGVYWNEAVNTGGCANSDITCIRNYIFLNHDGDPGVVRGPDDASGNQTGVITGQPDDPILNFNISVPANQRSATIDGFEFSIQQMFGDSGFGIFANYTYVDSDLTYDNHSLGDQFALEGLSDTANVVGFYEKGRWSLRLAWNWRDEFLSNRFDGTGLPNPNYTEAYQQFDFNAAFSLTDNLTFTFEAFNFTDEYTRVHGRNSVQALYVTQTGPRYLIGARYKF